MTEQLHFPFSPSCIGEGNGNPLQCSCLENPRDGRAWWLLSLGSHRVGHDWSDLAAAAACWNGWMYHVDSQYFVLSTTSNPITQNSLIVLANIRPLHVQVKLDRFCQFPQERSDDILIIITLNLLKQGRIVITIILTLQVILNTWHMAQYLYHLKYLLIFHRILYISFMYLSYLITYFYYQGHFRCHISW